MADPLGAVLLTEMLKKLVAIFGDRLKEKLFKDSDPRLERLVGLHTELRALELALVHLMDIVDGLLEECPDVQQANAELEFVLHSARRSLNEVSTHLEALGPGFEIMSEEIVPRAKDLQTDDELLLYHLGLLRQSRYRNTPESLKQYRARMTQLRAEAEAARKSVATFIRATYTWADFRGLSAGAHHGDQRVGYRVITRDP